MEVTFLVFPPVCAACSAHEITEEHRHKPWLQARCDGSSIGSDLVRAVVSNETAASNHVWPCLELLQSCGLEKEKKNG